MDPPCSHLREADGFFWDRGACVDKVATCALTKAFHALRRLGVELKGDNVLKEGRQDLREVLDRCYGEGVDYLYYVHGGGGE
ncbi:hypothetical protein JXL21_06480 [Candidatus Bathyarchaeota archaeon]|nr:hypothetical protein [Candidatus Bathyarchaeota archaeon]